MLFTHLVNQQVIYGSAIGIKHHSIIYLSDGSIGNIIRENMIDKSLSIITCNHHFTHVRNVKDTAMLSHRLMLVDNR